MHKSLLSMLAGALLFTMASMGHAASVHDSDYVAISVPDLQQATAFFHNVLDCEEVNPAGGGESLGWSAGALGSGAGVGGELGSATCEPS